MKLEISEQSIFSSFTGMVGVNNTIVQNKNCLKYIYVFEIKILLSLKVVLLDLRIQWEKV